MVFGVLSMVVFSLLDSVCCSLGVSGDGSLDGVGPVRRRDLGADLQRPDEPAMSRTVSGDGLEQPAGHRSTSLP